MYSNHIKGSSLYYGQILNGYLVNSIHKYRAMKLFRNIMYTSLTE